MEEEEEAHTTMEKAMVISADDVEAEDTTTLSRAVLLREDCVNPSVPTCLTTVRIQQQTKQDHHERNSYNVFAQIMDKT